MLHDVDITVEEFAKRHGIRDWDKPVQCAKCKEYFMFTEVFNLKDVRGIKIAEHGCGKMFNRSRARIIGKTGEKMSRIIGN